MIWPIHCYEGFFDNITYELAHLDNEKYGKINHDKLKHFHNA
jgi:hypothetical protein